MSILQRALHVGEAKKFKQYEKRVARINAFEPELELESDDELRARMDVLRERARNGESLDELLLRVVRDHPRGRQAHDGHAPLRRAAHRRHGPARRLDRRDEDRRGQDAHRDARGRPQLAARQGRPRRHRQRLPRPPRRRVDEPDLRAARASRVGILQNMQAGEEKHAAYAADVTYGTNSEFGFDYLRDNMATSLEEKSSAATRSRSSTRSTTSSSTRRARR